MAKDTKWHPMWAPHLIWDNLLMHEMPKCIKCITWNLHIIAWNTCSLCSNPANISRLLYTHPLIWVTLLSLYHCNSWPHALMPVIAYVFSYLPLSLLSNITHFVILPGIASTPVRFHKHLSHFTSLFVDILESSIDHEFFEERGQVYFHSYNSRIH